MAGTKDSVAVVLYETENAYVLCEVHLAAWRKGGNAVQARLLDSVERAAMASEWGAAVRCVDCVPCLVHERDDAACDYNGGNDGCSDLR